MRKRWIYAIQIALSLMIVIGLATGCAVPSATSPPSSTSSPPPSEYPADISGHVIIAETVKAKYQRGSHAGETMEMTPLEGQIYWIVDVSVKNKSYENPVTGPWKIVADDKVYDAQRILPGSIQSAYPLSVAMGETGKTTIRFPIPDTLKVSTAKLCYQGQEPYSYGKLTGGDKVAAYDWDSKTVVTKVVTPPIEPKVIDDWQIQLDGKNWKGSTVTVKLTITNLGLRRDFGYMASPSFDLVAIDSTEKIVEPWVPEADISKGELFYLPPYSREFYPGESWSGSLKYEMSPYSGKTKLYMSSLYRGYFLFDLGEPEK